MEATNRVIVKETAREVLKGSTALTKTIKEAVDSKEVKGSTVKGINFKKVKNILILF